MVYLIKCESNLTCKIGYTNDPIKRLSQLQSGNPYVLELMGWVEGDTNLEKELHSRFSKYRMNGEWFNYCDEIRDYFGVDEYFNLNEEALPLIMKMQSTEARVFAYCLRYRNSEFTIDKEDRIEMGKHINANERTILTTLPLLLSKKILYKVNDNTYGLNPRYVFYGSTKERNKRLKALLELGCKDC